MFPYIENAKNTQLVDLIRSCQEITGQTISAFSTLMRNKRDDLVKKIHELLPEDHVVTDDGSIVPKVANGSNGHDDDPPLLPSEGELIDDEPEVEPVGQATGGVVLVEGAGLAKLNEVAEKAMEKIQAQADAINKAKDADQTITLVTQQNPRREGTGAHKRFALLMTSKTVGEYMTGALAIGMSNAQARRSLRASAEQGHIKLG